MNNPRPLLGRLEGAFINPDRGVVGIVEELVEASREHELRLRWQAGSCSVIFPGSESPDRIEVPLRKSVVRAALARVAALCNERRPGSVSPYGGQGEIAITADPSRTIHAKFVNTQETLSLELGSISPEVASLSGLSRAESSD